MEITPDVTSATAEEGENSKAFVHLGLADGAYVEFTITPDAARALIVDLTTIVGHP